MYYYYQVYVASHSLKYVYTDTDHNGYAESRKFVEATVAKPAGGFSKAALQRIGELRAIRPNKPIG